MLRQCRRHFGARFGRQETDWNFGCRQRTQSGPSTPPCWDLALIPPMPTITIWILAFMARAETIAFASRFLLRSDIVSSGRVDDCHGNAPAWVCLQKGALIWTRSTPRCRAHAALEAATKSVVSGQIPMLQYERLPGLVKLTFLEPG
jgi:hypothetical protein